MSAADAPPSLHVFEEPGYDGEYAYRLALWPFTRDRVDAGIRLDRPAYRQQRVLYPLLAWAASGGGRAERLPWALIAVNVAGVGVLGLFGGLAARTFGHHPLVGLAFPAYPGFLLTLGRDLNEIVAAASLLGGLVALQRGRPWPAALGLSLAALGKETALVAVLAVAAVWVVQRARGRASVAPQTFAVPLAVAGGWQLVLRTWWGRFPYQEARDNLGPPFAALVDFVRSLTPVTTRLGWVQLAEVAVLGVLVVLVAASLRSSRALPGVKLGFVVALALGISLSRFVWVEDWAFLRALTELFVLGVFVLLGHGWRRPVAVAVPAALASLGSASIRVGAL